MKSIFVLVPLLALSLVAQDKDGLAARRLYYQDNSPEVVFKATTVAPKTPAAKPPVTTAGPKPATTPTAVSVAKAQQLEKIQQDLRAAAQVALATNGATIKPVANLGVRYNVLKVDMATRVRTEVSPDTVFHENDCAAVRIQPNRGGYLYVFIEESSGRFRPLIPSEETPDEPNIVNAYNLMDVPQNYCFEMDDKPGTERLLLVVTDKPEDVLKLNDSLKNKNGNTAIAANEMQPFTSGLQGRDIRMARIGAKPTAAGEAPYSTYLVNAAATTADRLVLEIKLKHEK